VFEGSGNRSSLCCLLSRAVVGGSLPRGSRIPNRGLEGSASGYCADVVRPTNESGNAAVEIPLLAKLMCRCRDSSRSPCGPFAIRPVLRHCAPATWVASSGTRAGVDNARILKASGSDASRATLACTLLW